MSFFSKTLNKCFQMRKTFLILCVLCIFVTAGKSENKNAAWYYNKGASEAVKGNLEEAIRFFRKSLDKNSYYSLAHYGLGKAFLYTGSINEAVNHLQKAANFDRLFAPSFFYLGMAYLLDKRYNAAVKAFKNAITLDPSMVEAFYNIGVAYDETGRSIKARIYYEKYLYELEKKDSNILF